MVCGAVEARCVCEREDCDGVHRCACGGSWEWVDGEFVVHAYPPGSRMFMGGDPVAAALLLLPPMRPLREPIVFRTDW